MKKHTPLVEVKNVSVEFMKGTKVLDHVSCQLNRGELVSLIGLNGTGKTTLLKVIVGLVKPTKGDVKLHTDKIFYIPQKSDLDMSFPLTVKEFCDLFGEKGFEVFLKEVGMSSFLNRRVGSLSGGQFQRVVIAVALSKKPELLLLDESTSGVDIAGQESFYTLLNHVREKHGVSILLVSHDIHLVIKNADKVLCLNTHLCCTGTPHEVKQNKEFQNLFGKHLTPYVHSHDHVH